MYCLRVLSSTDVISSICHQSSISMAHGPSIYILVSALKDQLPLPCLLLVTLPYHPLSRSFTRDRGETGKFRDVCFERRFSATCLLQVGPTIFSDRPGFEVELVVPCALDVVDVALLGRTFDRFHTTRHCWQYVLISHIYSSSPF